MKKVMLTVLCLMASSAFAGNSEIGSSDSGVHSAFASFPDKVQLFKLILRNESIKLEDGRLASDALAEDLAEHQNPDPGVQFHAVCESAFVADGANFSSQCKYEIFRVWKRGNTTTTTYDVSLSSQSADGRNAKVTGITRSVQDN